MGPAWRGQCRATTPSVKSNRATLSEIRVPATSCGSSESFVIREIHPASPIHPARQAATAPAYMSAAMLCARVRLSANTDTFRRK